MIHVAVAAIVADDGRVLIARRPDHAHQGGLWEFPGGKLEPGEDTIVALRRELHEELGIAVQDARPLIRIPYQYPDRKVLLDVWRVDSYAGVAYGREGQHVRWVTVPELESYDFPPPNLPIITALALPERYLITPSPGACADWPLFLHRLELALKRGLRLVQLRAKTLTPTELHILTAQVRDVCRRYDAKIILNATPEQATELGMDGVQLSSMLAATYSRLPDVAEKLLVGVSCHSPAELVHANAIGADFALLSPIQPTTTHPEAAAIGWEKFGEWTALSSIPVYALGGMSEEDISRAWQHGGQGIAAITGLW